MGRFEFLNNFPLLQRKTDWLYIKFLKVKFFKNFDFLSDFYIISKIFKNYAKFPYSQISRNYPQWKRRYFSRIYPKGGIFLLARRHDGARRESFRACAEREIIEETGVKPIFGEEKFCYEFVNSRGGLQFEMWFEVTNFRDFENLDKSCATHGFECSDEGFYSLEEIEKIEVRPTNLAKILEKKFNIL